MNRVLLSVLLLPGLASAKPSVVAPELLAGSGVPPAIGKQFDGTFRAELGKSTQLVGEAATRAAMQKAAATGNCNNDGCGKNLAAAANARFVVSAEVGASDDIYQVKLSVYDAARQERSAVMGTCELCTAGEVNGTIGTAVGKLSKAFAKPANTPAPVVVAPPARPKEVAFELKSVPSGAKVLVDGADRGVTPLKLTLTPGSHTVQISKQGFVAQTRVVGVEARPVNLMVTLEAEKPAVVAAPPVPSPAVVVSAPPAPAPAVSAPVTPSGASGKYNGVAWGMTIGGAALAGVGTWLVLLDGDVTCTDGRGRSSCPTVYNTKGVGIAGLGIGAALVGAAVAIFAVGPANDSLAPQAAVEPTAGGAVLHWGGRF